MQSQIQERIGADTVSELSEPTLLSLLKGINFGKLDLRSYHACQN